MDKKKQIINAAIQVFAKQGLTKGKIADIAIQAGIGKGTIYEYFKSKDEIFQAIENIFISDTLDYVKKIESSNDSSTKKIEKICNSSLDLHSQMDDSMLIIAELWAQNTRGQLHGHDSTLFVGMYNDYFDIVSEILKAGARQKEFRKMNVKGVATALLAMLDGIIWQSLIFKNDKEFSRRKTAAIKAFMNGIII